MKLTERILIAVIAGTLYGAPCLSTNIHAAEFRAHPFLEFGIEGYLSAHAELVDIDGDQDLDIVVANGRHWPQPNMIYLNDGNGRMTESYRLGEKNQASYIVLAGDLDGDDDSDLIVIGDNLPIGIYINSVRGQFNGPEYLADSVSFARGALLADIDGDELADLVVVPRRGESKMYFGDGDGSFASPIELPIPNKGATGIVAEDIDFDGDLDLVAALRDEQSSVVLTNDGHGKFTVKELFNSIGDHRSALVGEFTQDAFTDVILGNVDGGIKLFAGKLNGGFETPIHIAGKDVTPRALAAGDLDQDGDLDIVVGGDEQANIALYNQGNSTFTPVVLTTEPDDTYGVSLGDLNGDGLLDVVFSNSESPNVVLLNTKN